MRKQKQAPRHVTPEQREQIRSMTPHVQQKMIAAQLGLSTHLVRKVQVELGMRPHKPVVVSPENEARILELVKTHGQPKIARLLGLRPHVVGTIMRRHGIHKPAGAYGCKYKFDKLTLAAIRRAIRESESRIAKEFGVTHSWIRKFRLHMWNSTGPKHWKRKKRAVAFAKAVDALTADDPVLKEMNQALDMHFVKMVETIVAAIGDGPQLADRCLAVIVGNVPQSIKDSEAWPRQLAYLRSHVENAVMLRESRTGLPN